MLLFDGRQHASYIDATIKNLLETQKNTGTLLIVLVGDNASSTKYIQNKIKLCDQFGIKTRFDHIPSDLPDTQIVQTITASFNLVEVQGGILQMPLPRKTLNAVLPQLPPQKDVDLLFPANVSAFFNNDFKLLSPVVRGFLYFVQVSTLDKNVQVTPSTHNIDLLTNFRQTCLSKTFTIIGHGELVGKPIAHLITALGGKVQIIPRYKRGDRIQSDYLILGTGAPNLVDIQDVNSDCHILDFGTAVVEGKIQGDLSLSKAENHRGLVSASPGGIGPIVLRFLLLNFLKH